MREFNVIGLCVKDKHYMVDISAKLEQIKKLVDKEKYFTINRARQYGKTTTLSLLEQKLHGEYVVASISFEGKGEGLFDSEERFCSVFKDLIGKALSFSSLSKEELEQWNSIMTYKIKELSDAITNFCSEKRLSS